MFAEKNPPNSTVMHARDFPYIPPSIKICNLKSISTSSTFQQWTVYPPSLFLLQGTSLLPFSNNVFITVTNIPSCIRKSNGKFYWNPPLTHKQPFFEQVKSSILSEYLSWRDIEEIEPNGSLNNAIPMNQTTKPQAQSQLYCKFPLFIHKITTNKVTHESQWSK
jgi:hypothetical protein